MEPLLAAKVDPTGLLDIEHLKAQGDRITLTVRDKVKIFDLNKISEAA